MRYFAQETQLTAGVLMQKGSSTTRVLELLSNDFGAGFVRRAGRR
jgi:hypothetical protein